MKKNTFILTLVAALAMGAFSSSEARVPVARVATLVQTPEYVEGYNVAQAVRQEQLAYYYSGQITKEQFNDFVVSGRQGALAESAAEQAAGHYEDAQWWKGWAAGIGGPI